MLAYVKRTTVKLDDEVDARVRHEAARRGMTVSEWVREAVSSHLPGGERGRRRTLMSAGSGHSGGGNISERIEELLAEDFAKRPESWS